MHYYFFSDHEIDNTEVIIKILGSLQDEIHFHSLNTIGCNSVSISYSLPTLECVWHDGLQFRRERTTV